jgi:hypothetical protein
MPVIADYDYEHAHENASSLRFIENRINLIGNLSQRNGGFGYGPASFAIRPIWLCCSCYSRLPQYLQKAASASWPSAAHSGQACVTIFFCLAPESATVTMPVGTAMMP